MHKAPISVSFIGLFALRKSISGAFCTIEAHLIFSKLSSYFQTGTPIFSVMRSDISPTMPQIVFFTPMSITCQDTLPSSTPARRRSRLLFQRKIQCRKAQSISSLFQCRYTFERSLGIIYSICGGDGKSRTRSTHQGRIFEKHTEFPRIHAFFRAHVRQKDTRLLNAERHEWQYPDDKNIVMTDGAEQLFVRAVEESISLIKEFVHCSQTRKPLKKELFGKNFLSGL